MRAPPGQGMRPVVLAVGLLLASMVLLVLGLGVGSQGLEAPWALWPQAQSHGAQAQILWDIRLPRTLGAWLAGALLGLAGAIAQGLFRNPLADPYLLGSASGASLGVALVLAVAGGAAGMLGGAGAGLEVSAFSEAWLVRLGLTGAAFAGAVLAVALTLLLAQGVHHTLRLLLAGVVVGMVLGALASLLLWLTPEALAAMQAFVLGSTTFVGWTACGVLVAAALVCLPLAWLASPVLDGLALGEATAQSLGLPLAGLRVALVGTLALATGAAVAQTGLIAFVGLLAPHLMRALTRTHHAWLLPLSALCGGVLLTAADLVARGALAPLELPVGALTAVMGGVYLCVLMRRRLFWSAS